MYEYISRYFDYSGPAKVKGLMYDMGNYPAGIPCEDMEYIIGELYQAREENEFNWAIGQLDDYEGIKAEAGETPLYRRDMVEVYLDNGATQAWIYWFIGQVGERPKVDSGDILEYLKSR